ncbi:MAG: hypothetical protein A2Y93_00630 [Chloroflexi bacterium RBG_13_68_17]|nr:MAG: hypothetical protein A2Y93_00630 [Chloroflexi bacterium RBG_13_68_17]
MSATDAFLGSILRAALTWLGRKRLPQVDGQIRLPGLSDPIEILRDRWGVPHVYARSADDLFFAQGFVHAQDRLWQMELNRRTASGRLSELFGPLALDTDRAVRTFGFRRLGEADWQAMDGSFRAVFEAYTRGVNAFLTAPTSKMPIEFTLLGYKPEPWQPLDSVAFSRVMIWQLSHAWYGEIVRAQVHQAVGAAAAAELEIHYPTGSPIILPKGIEFNRLAEDGRLQAARGPFLQRGLGSNSWVLSGARTTTGTPFLCNDMHLALSLPSLWYEVHLCGGGLDVTGVSLPGVPLIMVGHNAHIAWGMTLAYTDCEDLFLEEFDPQDEQRYRAPGGWLEAEVIPDPIKVKGQADPHIEEVVITRHGPIISDVVGAPERRLAVQSMALRPSPAIRGWYQLNQAHDWDEFVEAMRLIEAPQLNVVYGDTRHNIGYWVTGKVPVRAKGDGMTPAPGWSGEYEWIGEVPFEEMPHALNPGRGWLVTTNERIVPDDYPHFLGNVWMNGFRGRRLSEIIQAADRLGPDDFCRMQMDVTCIPGQEFVDRLKGLRSPDPEVRAALDLLRAWDGKLTTETVGGTVYEVARYMLVRNLLEPGLGPDLALHVMGQGFHPLLMSANEFYGHDTVAMLRMLGDEDSWWVGQAGGRQAVLERSLREAVGWLRAHLGPDSAAWQWGRIHRAPFPHAMGLQKPLDRVFNRGPLPVGGDADTPCSTAMMPNDPYDNKAWAPGFRQIIDLGDLSRSQVLHVPGQSGQLGSRHYDDLAPLWSEGRLHPMLWTREQVEREIEGRLRLEPA